MAEAARTLAPILRGHSWAPGAQKEGPLAGHSGKAPAGARRCRQAGVNGTLLLSACPGPIPLAESSQVTFEGAAAALGGSPKASGLLLAFSCPLARPAWAWPEGGLTSAWPRKAAQPANWCLRVQNRRMRTAAHTRILARPPRLSTGNKGQGRSVCLEALHPACPIDSQGCPAPEPPPVAGLSPGRSQRGRGLDPAVWPPQPAGRCVTGRLRVSMFVPTVGTQWDRDTRCTQPGHRFAIRAPSIHFCLS